MSRARLILAPVLFIMLIFQTVSYAAPASATINRSLIGEWTGTIEGDFTGYDDGAFGDFKRHAEFTFAVDEDGIIGGHGTGWEQYSGSCAQGSADNVTLKISGYYGRAAGPRYGDTGALISIEVTPDEYPTYCPRTSPDNQFIMHPFRAWYLFEIDLKNGASLDSGAVHTLPGYPPARGTDVLVIHGGGSNIECPLLLITPTFPSASDPRNFAQFTGTVSYRFSVHWEGKTPARVNFDVQGGSASINPSFVFNPANMQSTPISVLMDVTTDGAEEGEYPLAVDAWVIDPDTGEECHAGQAAMVTLVVGESRATDFQLVKRVGDVKVVPEVTDTGGQNVIIETGNNSGATFTSTDDQASDNTSAVTTIDVGSNTAIKEYDHVDYFANVLKDKAKTAEALAWTENDLLQYKLPSAWERLKSSTQEFVKETGLKDAAFYSNLLSCLFAFDPDAAEICAGQSVVYVSQGDLRLHHESSLGELADRVKDAEESRFTWERLVRILATPNAIIIPNGTELAVNVEQSKGQSTTSLTILDGSALVVDLVSEKTRLIAAGEKYEIDTTFMGQTAAPTDVLESVSIDSVPRWWALQVGDYGTANDWDYEKHEPAGPTNVFNDQEEVFVWTEFLNIYPPEHDITFKYYRPDDSLFWNYTRTIEEPGSSYTHWSSYRVAGYSFDLSDYPSDNNYGRWNIDVYADGQLVRKVPFYVVKNTLAKNQSATYTLTLDISSDSNVVKAAVEDSFIAAFREAISDTANIEIDDIEWVKVTILDNSQQGRMQSELKIKGQDSREGEPQSLSGADTSVFITTVGIDDDFVVKVGGGGEEEASFPSELAYAGAVDLKIGGSNIKALEFSANKRLVEGDSYSEIAITSRYEKSTGILVSHVISGELRDPSVGTVGFDFMQQAVELSIPTTLTISSIPNEIQQNQDVSISGTLSPPVDEGQIILTYQKNDASDEPIKRTVAVTNGAFSDSYNMEKDGTYTVSAEYLGSGTYLSSAAGAKTLTVNPSGCLIATAAFGSELTPQVQFLRNFRDNHILSTAAGSSFMNIFNSWYYSFSPTVADYERGQPWLQATVRAAIYPLFGILTISETVYASMPGEYGAVTAGVVASSMIGAVYFWPAAFAVRKCNICHKRMTKNSPVIVLTGLAAIAAVISVITTNPVVLMTITPLLVLIVVGISAIFSARLIAYTSNRITKRATYLSRQWK